MEKIDVKLLHKGMQSHGYICSPLFVTQVAAGLNSRPTRGIMLHGPAGVGKSFLPEVVAEVLNVKMFWHQVSAGTYETDLLLKLYPSEDTPSGMTIEQSTIYQAAIASQKERVLLVLDEWDKSRPSADGFFLDFFQSGRLPLPPQNGKKIKANLDNLMIMLTSNDERPFSEPFLRRFSKIDIEQLHPKLVKDALMSTHKDHDYLPNVLVLYCRALASRMEKPVTIQEMRQLLDAIDYLGKYADWDTLVRQFVTKTEENHILLKDAEDINLDNLDFLSDSSIKIDSTTYGDLPDSIDNIVNEPSIILPSLIKAVEWEKSNTEFNLDDVSSDGGLLENNEAIYSTLAHLGDPTDNSADLGWIKSCVNTLAIQYPIDIERLLIRHDGRDSGKGALANIYPMTADPVSRATKKNRTKNRLDLVGEVMLSLRSCERGQFLRMAKYNRHLIKVMTTTEVVTRRIWDETVNGIVRTVELNFRWTDKQGLQIIVPIAYVDRLVHELGTGSSKSAVLFRNSFESDSDICPSFNTFTQKNKMPQINIKALRLYHSVAEFGVTRFPVSQSSSDQWRDVLSTITQDKSSRMYTTSNVVYHEHLYYDTDWISCNSITAGNYTTTEGYHYIELRIHGNMPDKIRIGVTDAIQHLIPVYAFVNNVNGRTILTELSKMKSWVPYPYIRSSLCNPQGIKYTAFGNVGCFWAEVLVGTKSSACTSLKAFKDKYSL